MNIEIAVLVDGSRRTYTIYPEELQQIACNKAREDNPKAQGISKESDYMKINVFTKG